MTTEQPDAARRAPRPLRRRASDRVLGGVASGIADYFNIDPLIVRAVFVGLMIFGGSGLVLYVGAWLLIPAEGQDESPVEAGVRRLGVSPGGVGVFLLILFAIFVLLVILPQGGGYIFFGAPLGIEPWLIVVVLVVVLGIALLRRGAQPSAAAAELPPEGATTASAPLGATATTRAARVRAPSPPRGPLGMLTMAVALIVVGGLALYDTASPDFSVTAAQLLGVMLGIVGIGLVIGSWWGNARLLILPALLLLPVAWALSYIRVPIEGGVGSEWHHIVETAELQREYRLISGDLTLDLRLIEDADEPIEITASVAMGQLHVMVPPDAAMEVTTRAGAGAIYLLEEQQRGTDLFAEASVDGDGPRFILDLATGIGPIYMEAREPDPIEPFVCEIDGQPYPCEEPGQFPPGDGTDAGDEVPPGEDLGPGETWAEPEPTEDVPPEEIP